MSQPSLSRRRRWALRLVAMVGVPLLVLGGVELGLRLAGYGYPTDFFLPAKINGRDFYVPNLAFGYRFSPPPLVRSPMPLRMAARKNPNLYRVFLFGESAALGDPDMSYGVGRYLEVLLRERYPGTQCEVVCVAVTAINSHVILPIARECARHDGDLWVIYMGNNEMIGPFGASTVFGAKAPALSLIRANIALKKTKLGQLIGDLVYRLRRDPTQKSWVVKLFTSLRLRYDDADRLRVYEHFRRNLDDILRTGQTAGVPIVLSTMAVNLKDCAPFGSLHDAALSAQRQAEWETLYRQGIRSESAGSFQEALDWYRQAAAIDPQFADLQFRIGHCHLVLTNYSQAWQDFELAGDYDALPIRADTRINQIIKDAAVRYAGKNVYLVDAVEMLAHNSPAGVPGHELFYEHVHLNFAGNYRLARAIAAQVASVLPSSIAAHGTNEWASAELCDRRLAVTIWDRFRIWRVMGKRLRLPPYTQQSNYSALLKLHEADLDDIQSRTATQSPEQARDLYVQATASSPEDNLLHSNFAQFLQASGWLEQAIEEAQRVCELLPQMTGPCYYIGTLLVRAGRTSEAADYFRRAIAIRSDFVEAQNELGLLLAFQNRTAEATALFKRALRTDPTHIPTYLNLAFLEQSQGKLDAAMAHYREAARLQPGGPAEFFSQAVALTAQGRHSEAIEYYRTLIRDNREFWQARYLFGMELSAQGKLAEAQAQFTEVIRYRPDYAPAHLQLGVALAGQRKNEQALMSFRKALQLDPTNITAQQYVHALEGQLLLAR